MYTIALSVAFFAIAVLMLSVGVILKKRTPLKGTCNAAAKKNNGDDERGHRVCTSCECAKVTPHQE